MIATWRVRPSGETLHVRVVGGYNKFKELIDSHPQMTFLGWTKEVADDPD